MSSKKKKAAKIASRKKVERPEDPAAPKLVMVSDGHRVSANVTGRADCGELMVGWRYGTADDVICLDCKKGK